MGIIVPQKVIKMLRQQGLTDEQIIKETMGSQPPPRACYVYLAVALLGGLGIVVALIFR